MEAGSVLDMILAFFWALGGILKTVVYLFIDIFKTSIGQVLEMAKKGRKL